MPQRAAGDVLVTFESTLLPDAGRHVVVVVVTGDVDDADETDFEVDVGDDSSLFRSTSLFCR